MRSSTQVQGSRWPRTTSMRSRSVLLEPLEDPVRRGDCAAASRDLARDYRWSVVLEPIVGFCRAPVRAPDLIDPTLGREIAEPGGQHRVPMHGRRPGAPGNSCGGVSSRAFWTRPEGAFRGKGLG